MIFEMVLVNDNSGVSWLAGQGWGHNLPGVSWLAGQGWGHNLPGESWLLSGLDSEFTLNFGLRLGIW